MSEPDWNKFKIEKFEPPGVTNQKLLGFMDAFIHWRESVSGVEVVQEVAAFKSKKKAGKR